MSLEKRMYIRVYALYMCVDSFHMRFDLLLCVFMCFICVVIRFLLIWAGLRISLIQIAPGIGICIPIFTYNIYLHGYILYVRYYIGYILHI